MENNCERPIDYSAWTREDWQEYADWTISAVERDLMCYAYDDFWRDTQHTITSFDEASAKFADGLAKILHSKPELADTTFPEYIAQAHPKTFTEYFISRLPNEAGGLQALLQERLRSAATTVPAPTQDTAIVLRDNLRQAFAVVIDGELQWLCSKTDVALIMDTLRATLNMQPKPLAQLAMKFVPAASEKWGETSLSKMISGSGKQGTLDAESASQAVLPYLVK